MLPNEPYLYTILWDFTKKCNLQCIYCYNDYTNGTMKDISEIEYGITPPSKQPDMTLAQIREHVIPQFKEMNVKSLCLSGGEPLVRFNDIIELAPDICSIGLQDLMFATNGTLLDEEKVKALKKAYRKIPQLFIAIPIDSLDPAKVAEFRPPLKNVLEKSLNAIDLALKKGFMVTVESVITKKNIDELDAIINLSKKKGMMCYSEIYPMFAEGKAKEQDSLSLSAKELKEFDRKRINEFGNCVSWDFMPFIPDPELWKKIKPNARIAEITEGCIAGGEYLQLDHAGNVYPCSFLRIHCGNLLVDSLKDIWEKNEMLVKFRNREISGKCGHCKHKLECGGCRARAFTETGDPYGGVESCEGGADGHPLEAKFTEKLIDVYKEQYNIVMGEDPPEDI
ncbi:MAG: radical SAM protein [Candidatus Hodarchaeota archaeon]